MQFTTIKDKAQFDRIFKNGVKFVTPFFVMLALKSEETNSFGFIATKKVFKRSVDRNYCRRKLKAAINRANSNRNVSCVIIARSQLLKCEFETLVTSLAIEIDKI